MIQGKMIQYNTGDLDEFFIIETHMQEKYDLTGKVYGFSALGDKVIEDRSIMQGLWIWELAQDSL